MKDQKPNNIWAFPCPASKAENATGTSYNGTDGQDGMTLRDYFAAKAMQGLWASHANPGATSPKNSNMEDAAIKCYEMADAMLKQREL